MVVEGNFFFFFFLGVVQLTNEEEMTELQYHHFANPDELMDPKISDHSGCNHQKKTSVHHEPLHERKHP